MTEVIFATKLLICLLACSGSVLIILIGISELQQKRNLRELLNSLKEAQEDDRA